MDPAANEVPLSPGEVAQMLRVHPRTVTRWANEGLLTVFRTPAGHRRFRRAEVEAFLVPETIPPRLGCETG